MIRLGSCMAEVTLRAPQLQLGRFPRGQDSFCGSSVLCFTTLTMRCASSQAKLELYGLYKQATEGHCTAARPAIWNLRARAKWCVTRTTQRPTA